MSGFAGNIQDPKIEKHTLLVLSPRMRVTGWTNHSGSVYKTTFNYGYVTRVWDSAGAKALPVDSIANVTSEGVFFFDTSDNTLYVFNQDQFTSPLDPDSNTYPGLTVEFELAISDQTFIGPRDPLDASSTKVTWRGALKSSPLAQIGSSDNAYGFLPMNSASLEIKNSDGWMNPILYAASFYRCPIKAYVLANPNLYDGIVFSEVKQIFSGYGGGMNSRWPNVTVQCVDAVSFFDKKVTMRLVQGLVGTYADLDPAAVVSGAPWFIPRLWGIVEQHKPINLDYDATPAVDTNRIWLTHQKDTGPNTTGTDGTLTYTVDHLAANTATRTYFTTAPKVRVGDSMVIQRSATDRYVIVTAVGANYVDHDVLAGSAASGDTATRYFVSLVTLEDPDGNRYPLKSGRDYSILVDNTNNIRGFTLIDNLEAAYTLPSTFDPSTWRIYCTVYGRIGGDSYGDASAVGSVVDKGGVTARAINVIFHLLQDAGYDVLNELCDSQFQAVEDDSYAVGLVIPSTRETTEPPYYREVLNKLLASNMYRMAMAQENSEIKLGITQVGPFPGSADYSANEQNHRDLSFSHDYAKTVSRVIIVYRKHEVLSVLDDAQDSREIVDNSVALDLHLIEDIFSLETLLVDPDEAEELAQRYAYLLGDRRGFWTADLELPYVDKSNLGATYDLSRQHLPGAAYTEGTENTKQLIVAEVNKSSRGVTITFEDQKGVQDNSGSW